MMDRHCRPSGIVNRHRRADTRDPSIEHDDWATRADRNSLQERVIQNAAGCQKTLHPALLHHPGKSGFVFAFDAADLTENIEQELPIGGVVGIDPRETVEPIRRLKKLAHDKGYPLIPGHDPHVWPAMTEALAGKFGA